MALFPACCPSGKALKLEQVTIVSRHGVRAPLEQNLAEMDRMLGMEGARWYRWPVAGSHLTLRGGVLEYMLGAYWRAYLDSAGFRCTPEQAYFRASPKQRTVATARDFAAGLFPGQEVPVSWKDFDSTFSVADREFLPLFNDTALPGFDTTAFKAEALREMQALAAQAEIDYAFLEEIVGLARSPWADSTRRKAFSRDMAFNVDFVGAAGRLLEPAMACDLGSANKLSDALILQYYEMEDARKAAFGRELGFADWQRLASVKDAYGDILFTAPIVSVNVTHAMFAQIKRLLGEGHKLIFLCSHDSMIQAMMAALRVEPYALPGTIEQRTPIGFELVLERFRAGRETYGRLRLVYNTSAQVREQAPADMAGAVPASVELHLAGLEPAPNGLYRYADLMQRLDDTLDAYAATARGENPFN